MFHGSLPLRVVTFYNDCVRAAGAVRVMAQWLVFLALINKVLSSMPRLGVLLFVVVWRGVHSRSDTNRTGAEGLFFYYPRLLYCLNQMLAVMLLSQHRVSSSKTVRPRAPCGARCIGHAVRTWSVVCSQAPHLQFGEGARPHLCMDE